MAGYIDIFKKKKLKIKPEIRFANAHIVLVGYFFVVPMKLFAYSLGYFCNLTSKVTPPTCCLIKFLRTPWDTFAIPQRKLLHPLAAL